MKTAAVPSSLRRINRSLILRHMVQVPAAARGELAEVAGTSCVTAGKIVDELLEQGVLEAAEFRRESRPGRPGQSLRLNSSAPRFLLIQIGVAHTRLAFATLGASDERTWTLEFDTPDSALAWEAAASAAIAQLMPGQDHGAWGVLLCVPGIVDESTGRVLYSPNVHWSEGVDFPLLLRRLTGLQVEVVQEIRALALGQLAASALQKDFLLVDFGHGVGGASAVGGALYPGALPLVGELGHTPVMGNDRPCGCGAKGCMETLLSRRGFFQSIQECGDSPVGKYSWSMVERHIHEHGLEPWLMNSLQAGAASIAGAMNVLGLGRVVITGTLVSLPASVQEFLAAEIRKAVLWAKFGEVVIEFAHRRRMRGLISVGIERFVVGIEH